MDAGVASSDTPAGAETPVDSAVPGDADARVDDVELPDGRRIVVRHGRPDDADALDALYHRLPLDDLWLRFFTAAAPAANFSRRWLSGEHGGLVLVAMLVERSGTEQLIGEAGYSLQADGDGELGITVDPGWRGWFGPWLLAVLLREAAGRGVRNLQAVVQLTNRRMLSVLRQRGSAVVDQEAPDEIRLSISTSGHVPSWAPDDDRPRILVEATAGRWAGEHAAREAGFAVRTCRGPNPQRPCPLLDGGRCPLVDGADAVVLLDGSRPEITGALRSVHERHPDVHLLLPVPGSAGPDPCDDAAAVVDTLRRAIGAA